MKLGLEAIKERCRALDERIGKGPWMMEHHTAYVGLFSVYDSDGNAISRGVREQQAFIAHSRADVPALVAEVERLRERLRQIKASLDHGAERLRAELEKEETGDN